MTATDAKSVAAPANLPRHRLDARIGWQQASADGLVPQGEVLHLAAAVAGPDGLVFQQPIPDGESNGSFGGRTIPRGLVISGQGEVYLADPDHARILYTRASLPPPHDPADPFAPFVPLFALPEGPHPLHLSRPVALGLVPDAAPPGSMADTLVIADAGPGPRLLWLDRRHGVLRHEVTLPGAPIALGVSATGLVRVAVRQGDRADLLTLRLGRVQRSDPLDRAPHSVHVMAGGLAVLADVTGLWALDLQGRTVPVPGGFTPPPLQPAPTGLVWRTGCENRDPLFFETIRTDRRGALNATGLPILTTPRKLPRPRRGTWIAGPFDGGARGFAWHRIGLDAVIPDQCRVLVSTHVSDFQTPLSDIVTWSGNTLIGPGDLPEALVQVNRGRYLWLRIEAFGNGTDTAAISGIDIFGPRRSQLDLLPAPFRQDPQSADFLDRFLSLQDAFLAEALALYAGIGAILRPQATPLQFLDWLGSWFDWQFLAEWDASTRRQMIAGSMLFFSQRGTIAGLGKMLRWHIGPAEPFPVILEGYRLAQAMALPLPDGQVRVLWIGGTPIIPRAEVHTGCHTFTVVLPRDVAPDTEARLQIDRIIAAQKPAHTRHLTIYVSPGCRLAEQALLGIDAILPDSRPPPLGAGHLGDGIFTVAAC